MVLWLVWVAGGSVAQAEPPRSVERVAVLVAANDGGPGRATLRYSESDARQLGAVLQQVGGVEADRAIYLYHPSPARIERALERAAARAREVARSDRRVEFIFYYSGHSDEKGLLLGKETMRYADVRAALERVPADVRIAILDSCASGAFTRIKGGTKRPPFLVGSTSQVRGHAFLTSSSAEETAQESDRIGGSFFTHYLVTGLRGAADRDRDRRVTLAEAYQFAYDETLARTQTSHAGAQHATYDIRLSGAGELVMTDMRRTTGRLHIEGDISGRAWVRADNGRLTAELVLPGEGEAVLLALERGRYEVTVDDPDQGLRQGQVDVPERGRAVLSQAQLGRMPRESTTGRGSARKDEYVRVPVSIGLLPALKIGRNARPEIVNFSAFLLWSRSARLRGFAAALIGDFALEEVRGAQWSLAANVTRGSLAGVQMTLGVNWAAAHARGVQWALTGNGAERLQGLQASLGFNWAETMLGAQLGTVNVASEHARGVQVGIVNIGGDVRGAQIGIINVARKSTASVGLLSVTREGGVHPEVWTSDTAAFNVGVRFGARYTYSFLAAGFHPAGKGAGWQFGAGLGGHIPLAGRASIDVDVAGYAAFIDPGFRSPLALLGVARVLLAWQLRPRLALWGGPSFNLQHRDPARTDGRSGYGWASWGRTDREGDDRIELWPGFAAGLRF